MTSSDVTLSTSEGRIYVKTWNSHGDAKSDKAPIVLFHDSLGSVQLWRSFPEHLAEATGRTVIAYDRLGFGQSDAHPGTLNKRFILEEAEATFDAVRQALDIHKFIAFGHSVGGAMAAACAAHYPYDCEALITESAQAFVEDRTVAGIEDAKIAFAEEGQVDRLARYHGDKARWVLSAWIDTWLSDDFQDWQLDETLKQVQCPVLAIHGDDDEFGSPLHAERYTELPHGPATLKLLKGCGHVPHREQEDEVLEVVREFLG